MSSDQYSWVIYSSTCLNRSLIASLSEKSSLTIASSFEPRPTSLMALFSFFKKRCKLKLLFTRNGRMPRVAMIGGEWSAMSIDAKLVRLSCSKKINDFNQRQVNSCKPYIMIKNSFKISKIVFWNFCLYRELSSMCGDMLSLFGEELKNTNLKCFYARHQIVL